MDKRTAGKLGGLAGWQRDPEGKRADALRGGQVTKERYGRQHFIRMRAKQLEARK